MKDEHMLLYRIITEFSLDMVNENFRTLEIFLDYSMLVFKVLVIS